jgi:hypothetical protein
MKLYKPRKDNKGSALSVNYSARVDKGGQKGDKSLYIQLVQQVSWDESSGNGTFKDGKKIITKFAPHEIAAMLAAIKRNVSMADTMGVKYVFHDGDKFKSNIVFEPYFKSVNQGGTWVKSDVQSGFVLKVTKTSKENEANKDTIGLVFTWAEVELFSAILNDALSHIANAWYAENIARASEAKPKKAEKVVEMPEPEEPAEEGGTTEAPPESEW